MLNSVTHATTKAMDIHVSSNFKPSEDCALGKAKQGGVSKKAVAWLTILGESFPSTPTFGSKKHWLLAIDDSSNYIWSFFLKEKSNLVDISIGIIKNLKNKYNLHIHFYAVIMQDKILS